MKISEAISARKSVRAYLEKPIANNDLEKIVEAGQWAPNAGPFQITIIRNKELLKKINKLTYDAMLNSGRDFLKQRASLPGYQPLYGAPLLILLSGPIDAPYSAINTALAAENMLLEATGLGFGSCFIVTPTLVLNAENSGKLVKEAGIPDGHKVQCAVLVGYTAPENKFTLEERHKKGSVNYID